MTVGSCITLCLALGLATGGLGHRRESAKHNNRMLVISARGGADNFSDAPYFAKAFTHNETTPTMHKNVGPPESSPPPGERPLQKGFPDGTSVRRTRLTLTSSFTQFGQAATSGPQTIMREAAQGSNSTVGHTEEALVHGAGNFSTGKVAVMMDELFRVASLTLLPRRQSKAKELFKEFGPEQGEITRGKFVAVFSEKKRKALENEKGGTTGDSVAAPISPEELREIESKGLVPYANEKADKLFGSSEKINFERFCCATQGYPTKGELVEAFSAFDQDAPGVVYKNQIRQRHRVFRFISKLMSEVGFSIDNYATVGKFFGKLRPLIGAFTWVDGVLNEMDDGDVAKVFGVKDIDGVIDYVQREKKEELLEKFKTFDPDPDAITGEVTTEKFAAALWKHQAKEFESKDPGDVDIMKKAMKQETIEIFKSADKTGNPERMNFEEFLGLSMSAVKQKLAEAFRAFDEGTRDDLHEWAQVFKVVDGIVPSDVTDPLKMLDNILKLLKQMNAYTFINEMVDDMEYGDDRIHWQDLVARLAARLFDFE